MAAAPGSDPIKKIYSVHVRSAGSGRSDWLKKLSNQTDYLKNIYRIGPWIGFIIILWPINHG